MFISDREIVIFWQWFESISKPLLQNINDTDILINLNNRVKKLGNFDWEIGPINDELHFLAISPNLKLELLKTTNKIIEYAPSCEGWSFLAAKPKKEYSPVFDMTNEYGKAISVNISTWTYVLYYFKDGTFDIDVKVDPIEGDVKTLNLALEIALTNLLGEERFLTLFKNVKIVNYFGEDLNKSSLLRYLSKHVDEVLEGKSR